MEHETSAAPGPVAFILHHLKFLTSGEGFWALNLDTLVVSALLGIAFIFVFWLAARKATAGVPGRLQNAVEWVIDFVDGQVKDAYHHSRRFVGPLALTIFMWVFLFNAMDLLPVDLLPSLAGLFGLKTFKSVPQHRPQRHFWHFDQCFHNFDSLRHSHQRFRRLRP